MIEELTVISRGSGYDLCKTVGVTEPLTRILNNNSIQATTRPVKTLQQAFTSPKSRPPSDQQTTAHGISSEKLVDAYTLEKRNTYETPKFLKVVPILPAMCGSKATLLILRMHASSTDATYA